MNSEASVKEHQEILKKLRAKKAAPKKKVK